MKDAGEVKALCDVLSAKRIRETSRYAIQEFATAINGELDGAVELILRCHNGHVDAELRIGPPGTPAGQIHPT